MPLALRGDNDLPGVVHKPTDEADDHERRSLDNNALT
jgi:hypothetical protein